MDIIEISGKKTTACILLFLPNNPDEEEQIIHMDELIRFNAGTEIAEFVNIKKTIPEPAIQVAVALEKEYLESLGHGSRLDYELAHIHGRLLAPPRPMTKGDKIGPGNRERVSASFTVLETTPENCIVQITPKTKIEMFLEEPGKMQTRTYSPEERLMALAAHLRTSEFSEDDVTTFLSNLEYIFFIDRSLYNKLEEIFNKKMAFFQLDRQYKLKTTYYIHFVIDIPFYYRRRQVCQLINYSMLSTPYQDHFEPSMEMIPSDFRSRSKPIPINGIKFDTKKATILKITAVEFQGCCNALKPSKQEDNISYDMTYWKDFVEKQCGANSISTLFLATLDLIFAAILEYGWEASPIPNS